jgi:hypothetical protein
MPTPPAFAQAFPVYLTNARTARAENRHHDYRRGLFLDLLRQAFGIRADEVDVEQFVRIDMRRRGWIDALFRNLVFEFKRDLERERGRLECARYAIIADSRLHNLDREKYRRYPGLCLCHRRPSGSILPLASVSKRR